MTKPIINGIDVSECVFFKERYTRIGDDVDNDISFENHCMLSEYTFSIGNCKKINCYFKQLKRLQEENKRLNQELDIKEKMLDKFMIGSGETLEKLQKENEGLKNTPRLELDTSYIREKELECIKYKQALEEIRNEIGDLKNINRLINLQKILDTINEVLNDRD